MDKSFHPTLYNGWNCLSMLGLKSIHVSKRGPRSLGTWPQWSQYDQSKVTLHFFNFFYKKNITSSFHTDNKCLSNLPRSFWVQLNSHMSYWEYFAKLITGLYLTVSTDFCLFKTSINKPRHEQNGCHFADNIFNSFFWKTFVVFNLHFTRVYQN